MNPIICTILALLTLMNNFYLQVAKRLARTLHLNYFDSMDLSPYHDCRHATTRHLESLLDRENGGMLRTIARDIHRTYLTHKVDSLRKRGVPNALETLPDPCERPNWPYVKLEELKLGVPLDRVIRLRAEKRTKETWTWWLRYEMPSRLRRLHRAIRLAVIGRTQHDDLMSQPLPASAVHRATMPVDEEELDEGLTEQLIAQLEAEGKAASRRQWLNWLLPFRTGKFERWTHAAPPLSVASLVMMRKAARYMALRTLVRRAGHAVPGLGEELGFLSFYTGHERYAEFYRAEMDSIDPHYKWHNCVAPGTEPGPHNRPIYTVAPANEHEHSA